MANRALSVSVSPHLHEKGQNIQTAMRDVLIALVPAAIVAIIVYGMSAFYVMAVSIITAVLTETVIRAITRRKITTGDLSSVVTGLLFAFLLPPTTPWWVVAIGAFVAIAIAKELLGGGLGKNVFNPALFARVVIMISPLWIYTTRFVKPFFYRGIGFFTPVVGSLDTSASGGVVYETLAGNQVNAVTSATPLSLLKSGKLLVDTVAGPTPVGATWTTGTGRPALSSMFLGTISGSIGELSVLALAVGAAYLLYRRTIDWRIPAGVLGGFLFIMLVTWNQPIYQLFGGGLMLGAFYMATDWTTSPMTRRGKWMYGVGIGVMIALIRLYSPLPEGTAIAILTFNVIRFAIDRYVAEPKFGEIKKPWFNRLPVFPERKPKEGESPA